MISSQNTLNVLTFKTKLIMETNNVNTSNLRTTPYHINQLDSNEIFVFGSNAQGAHGGGAAAFAMHQFGAIWGQGEGLQGQSYAIPTMGTLAETKDAVDRFAAFARQHTELCFMVTAIGCGIAGYTPAQHAPLFREASQLMNVYLPQSFWNELTLAF